MKGKERLLLLKMMFTYYIIIIKAQIVLFSAVKKRVRDLNEWSLVVED